VAWAEAYRYTKWNLIHPTVWPQYTNVTDRQTDNGSVAQGEPQNNDALLLDNSIKLQV